LVAVQAAALQELVVVLVVEVVAELTLAAQADKLAARAVAALVDIVVLVERAVVAPVLAAGAAEEVSIAVIVKVAVVVALACLVKAPVVVQALRLLQDTVAVAEADLAEQQELTQPPQPVAVVHMVAQLLLVPSVQSVLFGPATHVDFPVPAWDLLDKYHINIG
jgi:hypothetical protein